MIATWRDFSIITKGFNPERMEPAVVAEVRANSMFVIEKGLIDPNAISFRSLTYPDRYIRHRG
ncbi:AbfB domain-containing protein [Mycolicibacterium alvei]|uniref:AbfB domain-containing protein n=1 Tax=Mycolicibacterium alvei TaxID=67081 RepID=UPI0013D477CF|nr:AbfB domain-containing protein [Mycolicibacterium alvei]MCV7003085.1 AbfB domain-containing protein [Mycolicibacterium alvei]